MELFRLPEHLTPGQYPQPGGPIVNRRDPDARLDIASVLAGQEAALRFAEKHHVAILNIGTDRTGTYAIVASQRHLQSVFGEECAWIQRHTAYGARTEIWLGTIEVNHQVIRFFWREVQQCVH